MAQEALKLAIRSKFKKGESQAYSTLGVISDFQGNYPEALRHHFAAMAIREKTGDIKGMASTYNNIGIIYKNQGNFQEALKCYNACIKLQEQSGDNAGLASTFNNIGNIHFYLRQDKDALLNYEKALSYLNDDRNESANIYNNIGNICESAGNYTNALDQFLKAVKIYERTGSKAGIAVTNINIGNNYVTQKKYNEAKQYLERSLMQSLELGEKEYIMGSYEILAKANEGSGDHKKAFENYKLYIAYRDSLTNEENTKKTVQMQMTYQFNKQQVADSIRNAEKVEKEKLRHEQQIKQQKIYTYGGIAGFVLMIFVAGISFRAYKQKQKDNHIISEQKKLVEEKQKELLDSIHYAKRIQKALMTSERNMENLLTKLR